MAVSDLTNTTWVIDDNPTIISNLGAFITFNANNQTYENFTINTSNGIMYEYSYEVDEETHWVTDTAYQNGSWINQAYKTIEIIGGTDVTNATLIAWLEANATQQGGGSTGTVLKIYSNDERATAYDIYVQGGTYVTPTKLATVQRPAPPGYEFTISFNEGGFIVYDGQDNTGTLIGTASTSGTQITGTCHSGYLFASYNPGSGYWYIIMDAGWTGTPTNMSIADYSSDSITIQVTGDDASGVVDVTLD